jgi:glycosyltransferase involved in cell wall biosynthesis
VPGPFFSVILPTYNRAAMARTAVKTVLWQSDGDWECLIVDDGSTDGTLDVLHPFVAADPRVILIRSDKNEGMNASRNKAIARATGRYVTFLDSDDLWLPERLAGFRKRLARSPDAGFIYSNAWVLRYGRIVGKLFSERRTLPEGVVPGHFAVGDRQLPYVTTNLAIRRDAFGKFGLFKTEMKTLDTELFARVLAGGLSVASIREPLSVRRLHGEQLTGRYRENFEESMLAVKASGAPAEVAERLREQVACEVAVYLVKAGRPADARAFLNEQLGRAAEETLVYKVAALPGFVFNAGRAVRELWLRARHAPAFAGRAEKDVLSLIAPLLSAEL